MLTTDTIGVGLKADYDALGVLFPYLRADAELVVLTHRLDDDRSTGRNVNQISSTGFAPAGRFTVGLEAMLPDRRLGWPVTVAVYVEGGYEIAANTSLGDLGAVNTSGGILAAGVGLRF
jgi:hypothetical protein